MTDMKKVYDDLMIINLYHVHLTTHVLVLSTAENVLTAFHLVSIPF